MTPTAAFSLDPGHDATAYAAIYKHHRRIHIPDILAPAAARRLHHTLVAETPWSTVVNAGDRVYDLTPDVIASMGEEAAHKLVAAAQIGARDRFQFLFDNHRLTDHGEPYTGPVPAFGELVAFVNSAPFLDFVRKVTGHADIAFADAQATCYRPGHFLTLHDDKVPGKNRRAAFVLNMTQRWVADWGGLLLFLDGDGHVAEGFTPCFNALNIFSVPQPHLVSLVSPAAPAPRLSITGWLRAR